ncbi:hypothetical protein GUJ93_ZPchr0002g23258 [Zizania palustris]|uniref:Uncharacterized protein n=1 Tax=Zizania palustris TaxID=103762 RepID=A0A8J5SSG1_ZIZPA|nr:hypothetical protein GUJ93_ZPchr0002g23258 [Zizania palustris]
MHLTGPKFHSAKQESKSSLQPSALRNSFLLSERKRHTNELKNERASARRKTQSSCEQHGATNDGSGAPGAAIHNHRARQAAGTPEPHPPHRHTELMPVEDPDGGARSKGSRLRPQPHHTSPSRVTLRYRCPAASRRHCFALHCRRLALSCLRVLRSTTARYPLLSLLPESQI